MADEFTRLKFAWLDQVAADADLPPFAARLAIILLRYYSRTERAAWPSIATLARDLGAGERSIQRALQEMTPRHLTIIAGGGRSATNKYRWNISVPATPDKPRQNCQGNEAETPSNLTLNPVKSVQKTPSEMTPEPFEENPLKEPSESLSIESDIEKRRPSAPKKGLPKGWEADFEIWWKQYPRRVAKAAAGKVYQRIIGSGKAGVADLMAGALRYSAERAGQDPQFTKHPATWLNGACWADERQAPAPLKATRTNRQNAGGLASAMAGIFGSSSDEDDFP
jgi:hypothetical protein